MIERKSIDCTVFVEYIPDPNDPTKHTMLGAVVHICIPDYDVKHRLVMKRPDLPINEIARDFGEYDDVLETQGGTLSFSIGEDAGPIINDSHKRGYEVYGVLPAPTGFGVVLGDSVPYHIFKDKGPIPQRQPYKTFKARLGKYSGN